MFCVGDLRHSLAARSLSSPPLDRDIVFSAAAIQRQFHWAALRPFQSWRQRRNRHPRNFQIVHSNDVVTRPARTRGESKG